MDNLGRFYSLIFIIINCLISYTYTQDVCVEKSACICEFSNGTGIDLTATIKDTFYSAQYFNAEKNGTLYKLSTYFFHPCKDILFVPEVPTLSNSSCVGPLSLCRHVFTLNATDVANTYKMDNGVYDYLGSYNQSKSKFSADGKSITFLNSPSSTTILLHCAQTDSVLQIYSLEEPNDIILSFYSKEACLKEIDTGRSFGSTLLIIFFSCLIFYLVLGICTKKFLMGATGIEVIPNLAFWSELPNLVKDGWAFTANGFKLPARGPGPVTTPDPNSYDSI